MSATNEKPAPTAAGIIVFGTAKAAKLPQAGWFRVKDTEVATTTALKLGLWILNVDIEAVRAIIPAIQEVQVTPGKEIVIPVIDAALLQKLIALHREAAKVLAGMEVQQLGGSSAARIPPAGVALWNALKVGDLVLAADLDAKGRSDDWYAAEILAIDGDTFTIKFRDYPKEGKIKLHRRHIALLHPEG